MGTLTIEAPPRAVGVRCSHDQLTVDLADGRTISVPLVWFPRLVLGTDSQRQAFELMGSGTGIHWPDLDEDISVAGLLAGTPSREKASGAA